MVLTFIWFCFWLSNGAPNLISNFWENEAWVISLLFCALFDKLDNDSSFNIINVENWKDNEKDNKKDK